MDVRHHSYKWEPHGALFQNGVQVSILLNWETQDTTPHEPLLRAWLRGPGERPIDEDPYCRSVKQGVGQQLGQDRQVQDERRSQQGVLNIRSLRQADSGTNM